MKTSTFLSYIMMMMLSSIMTAVVSAESMMNDGDDTTSSTVPFYLKISETNTEQVIAVVYYGDIGDRSKEIEVPCTMDNMNQNTYGGPSSITCTCTKLRQGGCSTSYFHHNTKMIDNSKCELHVPFHFEYDVNGTITNVSFDQYNNTNDNDNEVLIVPFYPKKDHDGNIVAVTVSNDEQNSSSSSSPTVVSILLFLLLITGIVIVICVSIAYIQRMLCKRPKTNSINNNNTTIINPMNVKNTADLEDPSPSSRRNHHQNNNDDDTATESSSDF